MTTDGSVAAVGGGPAANGGTARGGGVIHDLGYRRYEGQRLGRAAIVRALCWHSLRSAFGIGRVEWIVAGQFGKHITPAPSAASTG